MFLAETLTALLNATKRTFDDDYPVEDFRNLDVGIEYPVDEAQYPGIWVGFEPEGDLSIAGIDHREFIEEEVDGQTRFGEVTRWRFEGHAMFTIVSLSSLARARLVDELVRVLAFGHLEAGRGAFRTFMQDNPLVALQMDHDRIAMRGSAETPGTPWGTDDIIYEVTLSSALEGEFTSTPQGLLVPLSEIKVYPYVEGQPDPRPGEGWS